MKKNQRKLLVLSVRWGNLGLKTIQLKRFIDGTRAEVSYEAFCDPFLPIRLLWM